MAVNLSPVLGVAGQFFDNNGNPLAGGKIFTYVAGTTTNQATYTSATGVIAHSNPIILDAAGRVPSGEIWLTDGLQYKFVIKTSTDTLIGSFDNLTGINSNFISFLTDVEIQTATAGQTVFTLTTMQYQPATNSLSVFVDGVNQYDGVSYSYVETDSVTVTFSAGLHVGALVKFTTAQTLSSGVTDASLVTYDPPFAGSVPTNVEVKLSETVSVKDFGADSTGATSCSAIFATADASSAESLIITAGTYLVSSNVTFTKYVSMSASAVLNIANGVTVTFNGGFDAGIYQTFDCTGTGEVVFNPQYFSVGYPEWWGATTGNAAFDNTAALTACVVACPITELQATDYWITGTWKIQTQNAIVRGVNIFAGTKYTRVITTSATADVIFVGLDSDPGSINNMLKGVEISGIYTSRSVAVTPPIAPIDGAAGFRFKYVLYSKASNLKSDESTLGFCFDDVVSSYYYNLRAFRSASGSTAVNDFFWGFACFGDSTYKLQSVYWQDCNASIGGAPALSSSVGYSIVGSYTDCSFLRPEASFCETAFFHDQGVVALPSIDNHLIGGIFDQNKSRGVVFANVVAQSMISVMDTYCVTGNYVTAISNFEVRDCAGQISLVNCQSTARGGGPAIGLFINNSKNVSSRNNIWCDLERPIGLLSANNCVIQDSIYNKDIVCTEGAVELTTSSRNSIATQIYGDAANVYPTGFGGVRMNGTACTFNEVNCTSIDPSGLQTANEKLIYNGVAVTVTGTFGTNNLASGIMT